MQRYEIHGPISDNELNKINQNYIALFNEYRKAGLDAAEARERALRAVADSELAKQIAEKANTTAERVATEFGQVILNGDSSPLASQLTVGADGKVYPDAQQRFVNEMNSVNQQLDQSASNPKNFGAVGDGVSNDAKPFNDAFAAYPYTIIPETINSYRLHKFQGKEGQTVIGKGRQRLDLYYDDELSTSPVLAGLSSNSHYENLHFNSLEEQLRHNRVDLTSRENVYIRNCKFEGFRHGTNPDDSDAWGVYLKNSKRITLENCEFENNTQSDIALLEGSEDITIINAKGSNLHLNLEPNSGGAPIKRIKIVGGHYKQVRLLENSRTSVAIESITFENCEIDTLIYNGAFAKFENCIINGWAFYGSLMGDVDFGGAITISESLIKDDKIRTLSGDNSGDWVVGYVGKSGVLKHVNDDSFGRLLRLNPELESTTIRLDHTTLPVKPNEEYLVKLRSRAVYTDKSTEIGRNIRVIFLDSSQNELSNLYLYPNRQAIGTTPFNTEIGIFKAPQNAAFIKVQLSTNFTSTPASLDVGSITLHKIIHAKSSEVDFNSRLNPTQKAKLPKPPTYVDGFGINPVSLVGDEFEVETPVSGGYKELICVSQGNPGTWKGTGLIE